jgi:hypothetical protein
MEETKPLMQEGRLTDTEWREVQERVLSLEIRVRELEARVVQVVVVPGPSYQVSTPYPVPVYPSTAPAYPWWPPGTVTCGAH